MVRGKRREGECAVGKCQRDTACENLETRDGRDEKREIVREGKQKRWRERRGRETD